MSQSKAPVSLRSTVAGRGGAVAGFVSTLGLALTAAPLAAMAQAPTPPPNPEQLPPVTVSGDRQQGDYKVDRASSPKMPEPLRDTPKSVVVIPKELIKEQGATTLRDVLRTTPGISLSTAEGGLALGDRITIRGFDARGDIFIDGMRDPGVTSREAFNVEQVEIVKGPGSAYTGRGATGGSVNIVTKTPLARNLYAGDVTFGTDATKRVTVDVNQVLGDFAAIRLNGMWHDADVAERDKVFQKRWGFAPSLTLGIHSPTRLTLSYYHLSTDDLPDYGHPFDLTRQQPLRVRRDNFYGLTQRDFRRTSADIGTALLEHQFSDTLSFRSQFRVGTTTNKYVASAPEFGAGQPPGTVNANAKTRNSRNTAYANQTDLTVKFDTGSLRHTLVTGIDVSHETAENHPFLVTPTAVRQDLFNPTPSQFWLGTIAPQATFTRFISDSKAIYVFDNVKISEQWEVMAGLRLDDYRVKSKANAGNAVNGLKNHSTFLNWHVGAVYKPRPNGSIYVAVSSSSNPSGEQFDGGAADGGLAAANANLKPERNLSYEIGTKWDVLGERLSLTAALFRIDKTNARVTAPGGTTQVLDGKQRAQGIELGVTGKITDKWSAFGGFTWLDTEVVKSPVPGTKGDRLPNAADVTFSLWSTYQITDRFTVGGLVYYTSARYGGTFAAGPAHVPGYWRFDAMASYKITENVDVRLNVLNITNKLYYDAIYRSTTPFAFVGPGRAALLTTAFKF
ncbi:TonB-dependent siderophore receptor [Vineibacter terrae]|uniref:TonB-dependent receptor n=1 Tax=Vineibacter terrae TaxID=2586908 RepID=UPI002E3039E6|nr:TonB-dependent siderophore receptor [Vineibacter terrae]HEX2886443.1 TonB-dependent siderophore receptor [Vineibacter terrae]